MRLPEPPPPLSELFRSVPPERVAIVYAPPLRPEVDGVYLHWDQLRRRTPPSGLSLREWWLRLALGRSAIRRELPLRDKHGVPWSYALSDSVQRLLHGIDRELGNQLTLKDPTVANPEPRDRYIIRSLAEEAITSSQIEGASTTRKVAKEMLLSGRQPRNRDEQMIANNFAAMSLVRDKRDRDLSVPFILELHEVLTAHTLDAADEAGRFRRPDESVAVTHDADGTVVHVPPPAEELAERMQRLCDFANASAEDGFVHPVIRAILLHFGLAYDHPFVDGNGRTARALFYWAMLRHGYWLTEFLSISRIIQKAPAQYGRAFLYTETDPADATYFVLHQLEVLEEAISDLHAYLKRKARDVMEADRLLRGEEGLNRRQQLLVAHAMRHPGATWSIDAYVKENGVAYATGRADLMGLASLGFLTQERQGKRFVFRVPSDLSARVRRAGKGQGSQRTR